MRQTLARVVIFLSIALTLANAACFARCLARSAADHPVPPCHSQQKTHEMAAPQHDMQPSATATVAAPVTPLYVTASQPAEPVFVGTDVQPPLTFDTSPLPLRI